MNGATIILLVVLVLGTIAIIFLRPLIDFLYKHGLEKLFDKADHFSLSETEKARGQKERRFLEASPEALQSEFEVILSTHAGRYSHKKQIPHEIALLLPADLLHFFTEHDFLDLNREHVLNSELLQQVSIAGKNYLIVGSYGTDEIWFAIPADAADKTFYPVFAIDPDLENPENTEINLKPEKAFRSLQNFVCVMTVYCGIT